MSNLFELCQYLKSLPDISKWNTNHIISVNKMFNGCFNIIISNIIPSKFKL